MRKTFLLLVALCLFASAPLSAQTASNTLTKSDRTRLLTYLRSTRDVIKQTTKGLSPAQWNFKPAPDRWSAAECLEHITLSEEFLLKLVTDKVMQNPAQADKYDAAKAHEKDNLILKMIPDRSQKAQAPQELRPTGHWPSPKATLKEFESRRKRTMDFSKKEPNLRAHFMDSPVIKEMDAYQWLLFLAAHSERHTLQIKEVMSDPNFPKK